MATTNRQRLEAAYANYCRILLLVTEVIASPTKANIDAAVAATTGAGVIAPRVTHQAGDEQYDWNGYQEMVLAQMRTLKELIALEAGPYQLQTRYRSR